MPAPAGNTLWFGLYTGKMRLPQVVLLCVTSRTQIASFGITGRSCSGKLP